MLKPANSEEEFFAQLEPSLAIELNLKKAIGDMFQLRNIALKGIKTQSMDPEGLARRFGAFIRHFGLFENKLKFYGVKAFPAELFADISRATTWALGRMKEALPPMNSTADPIAEFHRNFAEFKNLVWVDSRDFLYGKDISDEEVFEKLDKILLELEACSKRIATAFISHYGELKLNRKDETKAKLDGISCKLDGISSEVNGISNEVSGISADSTEIRRVTTQLNNRDRRDHGLKADVTPISKEDCLECAALWEEWRFHPEWLNLKPKQRVLIKTVYKALLKAGKLPNSIKSEEHFRRALDNARK